MQPYHPSVGEGTAAMTDMPTRDATATTASSGVATTATALGVTCCSDDRSKGRVDNAGMPNP